MVDVFGGLAGDGPPDRDGGGPVGSDAPEPDLDALEDVLHGAAWWGAEIDTRYRVLALTFEPAAQRYPWDPGGDRRVQVLCHPVSTILAALRREGDDAKELLAFDQEQLVDVVAALDGPAIATPVLGQPEPKPGEWGPRFSMEGRATAGDGIRHTIRLHAQADDLELDLFARFDLVELRDATGETRALASPS